ncbi:c-type cytochrome [Methylocystis heyeri]|uniref:C-type cytochrome n=1 Tax=Methylocystis heyeri TaxID=391905 RepID=A0A6B8KF05_9HYPH|nr:c-type cytochrome [Methylocystis heyeri]QGM45585.1 c-type cytochrome [Methylocystis heyeri]
MILPRRRPARLVVVLAAGFCWGSPALAAGDAAHGAVIAKRWCAACHVVSADQQSANADAPPFADIAQRRPDDKQLRNFLADPHPKMPDMSLTRKEIEDIVAYIRRFDARPRPPAEPDEKDKEQPKRG